MKKGLIASYISGITDSTQGESFSTIIRLFLPEFVGALLLYCGPNWIEAYFIGQLQSTPTFATLAASTSLVHTLTKMAEGFAVGTMILAGQFNGKADYKEAGRSVKDAFWVTSFLGLVFASVLYFGAYWIYYWLGVPTEIISLGVPYLRLRAIAIFFMFVYLALVGFIKGIKNTRVPMQIFIMGAAILIVLEYLLIFGNFGFPKMGLQGSALAAVVQYGFMAVAALSYILFYPGNHKYAIDLFSIFRSRTHMFELVKLSWPVIIDKTTLSLAYMWLVGMISHMGSSIIATYGVIMPMERVILTPAIAFASIITFLVSNDLGKKNWEGIKSNIKKTVFLASFCVMIILVIFSLMPEVIIGLFDKKGDFTMYAVRAFPILGLLAFFDVLQVVLSGALRGAANVKTVMMVRLIICGGVFAPLSYALTYLPIADPVLKFVIIYGSFYVCNGIMSIIYINRFRSNEWKKNLI
ncbi:MAG: MATE family efflux transporter [Candidatus Babeliales bacterium]|nr:MATE family efflux transporter [Candidatus Babeliales bacterium]